MSISTEHQNIIDNAFRSYKFQDKLICRNTSEIVEEFLINSIDFYNDFYFLDENDPRCKQICSIFGYNKENILKYLKENYQIQLSLLKEIGGDVSEYPRNLEELIK